MEVTQPLSSPRKRVLVAEADEIVLALISHILNRQGYSVEVAVSAEAASKRLVSERFDAILLDANFSSAIASSRKIAPRTILLGSTDTDLPVHAILGKPIEFATLMEAVAGCVKGSEQ